jgi:hypothetical protein
MKGELKQKRQWFNKEYSENILLINSYEEQIEGI